jgi:NADH:ubiquinone reductase (H+-translocating)
MARQRHRVVIVGGGFGGLSTARALADADVDVTLVDRTNHHLFQPLLYQVAAGILPPGLIAPALRSIVRKRRNIRVLLAEVEDLDLDSKVIRAVQPDGAPLDLPYDTLVVAAGATHSYFGNNHFAEYAPGMKTIEDARYQRDAILAKFEMAELSTDLQERADWLTFVVVGAGPTGVELVGQIAELAHQVLPRDFRSIDTTEARILLLEGAPAVLPPFAPKLQQYTQRTLERMGVEVRLNTLATDMDHYSITVKGPAGVETIRTRTRIWAAGVQASPLAKLLADKTGAATDRPGRVTVNPDCSLPGHPEVFAIGDMANVNKLPGVAQPAIQEGRYVGNLIKNRLAGRTDAQPFKYFDKGSMATIGHKAAVADAFGREYTGLPAYLMWSFIHIMYLVGWGNRLGTMYTWGRTLYFSKNRGHRIITFEQAHERLEQDAERISRAVVPRASGPQAQASVTTGSEPLPPAPRRPTEDMGPTGADSRRT